LSSETQDLPALKILFATPECAPLVKTGGLGDVSAALPEALNGAGLDVRVLLPGYRVVLAAYPDAVEIGRMAALGHPVRLLDAQLPNGVPLIILDCPRLFDRGAGPYQADDGEDWEDNAMRFGVLSRVAATLGTAGSPLDWRPDVVHCNDWPAALAPLYLASEPGPRAATLVTIHNLAFQGNFTAADIEGLGLPKEALGVDGIEFYGRYSFLKGGLVYSDAITTVSPTYAREIQGETLGFGLQGVLRKRADRLFGVLNGIDTAVWDPQTDPHIARRYGPLSLENKIGNKLDLRRRFGLGGPSEVPLLGMVTRLTQQKGVDLVIAAVRELLALPAQVAIVGTGDRELMDFLYAVHSEHPRDFGVVIGFDEALAHQVEAGADAFLMPSRFEPCGMNQMYSQRYGTPPIANATGGLVDTIEDGKTGFMMQDATPGDLIATCRRALGVRRDPARWRAMQLAGMARDFGWGPAARQYAVIYRQLALPGGPGPMGRFRPTSSGPSRSGA
jgi:starch synthase